MKPEDLVGFAELAELLGVQKRTAARYVSRSDFPEPFVRLSAGPIWLRRDVETWAAKKLPLKTGRPPNLAAERSAGREPGRPLPRAR